MRTKIENRTNTQLGDAYTTAVERSCARCPVHQSEVKPCLVCNSIFGNAEWEMKMQRGDEARALHQDYLRTRYGKK